MACGTSICRTTETDRERERERSEVRDRCGPLEIAGIFCGFRLRHAAAMAGVGNTRALAKA